MIEERRQYRYAKALGVVYGRAAFNADVDIPDQLARAAMAIADEELRQVRNDLKRACENRDQWQQMAYACAEERAEAWDKGYLEAKPLDSQGYRDILNPYRQPTEETA